VTNVSGCFALNAPQGWLHNDLVTYIKTVTIFLGVGIFSRNRLPVKQQQHHENLMLAHCLDVPGELIPELIQPLTKLTHLPAGASHMKCCLAAGMSELIVMPGQPGSFQQDQFAYYRSNRSVIFHMGYYLVSRSRCNKVLQHLTY